jgi:hypothetical protein
LWVELKPAGVEVDGGLEVLAVAVAAGRDAVSAIMKFPRFEGLAIT